MCIYHGSPEERAEMRKTQLVLPQRDRKRHWLSAGGASSASAPSKAKARGRPKKAAPRPKVSTNKSKPSNSSRKPSAQSSRSKNVAESEDEDEIGDKNEKGPEKKDKGETVEDDMSDLPPNQRTTFPVVLTTYEIVMKDRAELSMYKWGFVVVDEGHRLKNMECRLMQELKALPALGRMVLTGTPLHVRPTLPARNDVTECTVE